MKLTCTLCGIQGKADLAFIWYGKKLGKKTLWLCPDCCAEFDDDEARDRFLAGERPTDVRD